jgi:polyisoprenyl-teichoic acid--peptidoglycan teichoic acid transferase
MGVPAFFIPRLRLLMEDSCKVCTIRAMLEDTQPTDRMSRFQAVRAIPVQKRGRRWGCCLIFLLPFLVIAVYFFAPLRTNILLLGTDDSLERGSVGRTDTIILATVVPLQPYVGMLSIPRDLWVQIPNVGEQRINTAYFFAEANQPGAGAEAALETIRRNFDVPVRYYAALRMSELVFMVDALGGVDIQLPSPLGGLPAGTHHLTGEQALAFARDRSTSDDFGRMAGTQILLTAVMKKAIQPASWDNLPQFIPAVLQAVETNIPLWQLPRLSLAMSRAFITGVESRTITREMVTPFQTSQGAQVLAPNWEAIRPLLKEMFGR